MNGYGKHDFPDVRLTVADLKELVQRFNALIKERTGKSVPQDPQVQLWGAIGAVFGSWMNDRAKVYRQKYEIPARMGHGRKRAGHGLRKYRGSQRHRCCIHARPGDRREQFFMANI